MAENTKIQWATHTFNPWRGCSKIAPGCANCYADAQSKRNPGTLGIWGSHGTRVVASEAMWREPVKWDRDAEIGYYVEIEHDLPAPRPRCRVFCASLSDVFEDYKGPLVNSKGHMMWVDRVTGEIFALGEAKQLDPKNAQPRHANLDDVRTRLFRTIDATPNLDWLLLTKRPENVRRMWPEYELGRWDSTGRELPRNHRRPNVWLGTSIACQEDADRNVPELLKCRDLCAKTFLSIEPLIGPVNLRDLDNGRMRCHWNVLDGSYTQEMHDGGMGIVSRSPHHVDWVIVGGESGPNARPCDITWIRSIARQCRDAGVPCFVKQLGSSPVGLRFEMDEQGRPFCVEGNNFRGRARPLDPKGGDPAEWPEDLRVREVPS